MPIIAWNETYSVGVPDIDEQHKRWIQLINDLHDAMANRQGKAFLSKAFQDVVDYTHTHFDFEQKKMEECKYPDLPAHKKIHDEMVMKVHDLQKRYESGEMALTIEVMQFLRDWLTEHIMDTDRKYSPYMKKG